MAQYKDVIYPEKEYIAFGKALISADPRLDDLFEDQDIINMYNQIKAKDPAITIDAVIKTLPAIVKGINEKMAQSNPQETQGKLSALKSIGA